jgi:hypothetical protein
MITKLKREDIILDPNADYINDPKGLAILLIEEILEFRQELASGMYDENDPYTDYLQGTTEARDIILGRMGVDTNLYRDSED